MAARFRIAALGTCLTLMLPLAQDHAAASTAPRNQAVTAAVDGARASTRPEVLRLVRAQKTSLSYRGIRNKGEDLSPGTRIPATQSTTGSAAGTLTSVSAAQRLLGTPLNGQPWFSGTWTGDFMSAQRVNAFASWRASTVDATITYPERWTFQDIAQSEWHIATFDGVPGKLVYGLPLLPENRTGTFAAVAAGQYDWVWAKVAKDLVAHGRSDSIVRVGWEANGDSWFAWGADASNAASFKAAFRRAVQVMRRTAPSLKFGFDITCGRGLTGDPDRMASLTKLYPGNDVVDIVGCDHYDSWSLRATDDASWRKAVNPYAGPGLADVAAFARARGKGFAIPEWGVVGQANMGNGDNPFFIDKMHEFMTTNRDILVYEAYFNDAHQNLQSSLWLEGQNPRSATRYRALWGEAS